jgi:hypothetical protein
MGYIVILLEVKLAEAVVVLEIPTITLLREELVLLVRPLMVEEKEDKQQALEQQVEPILAEAVEEIPVPVVLELEALELSLSTNPL